MYIRRKCAIRKVVVHTGCIKGKNVTCINKLIIRQLNKKVIWTCENNNSYSMHKRTKIEHPIVIMHTEYV